MLLQVCDVLHRSSLRYGYTECCTFDGEESYDIFIPDSFISMLDGFSGIAHYRDFTYILFQDAFID